MGASVYRVAIKVLSEMVTPKQSLKKQEAALEIWGQSIPVRGKRKCSGPNVGTTGSASGTGRGHVGWM